MSDFYIENPEALLNQPKRTIGAYVEQNGLLVPRRFDSVAEGRRSHKGILLRSEHSQEYDGVSGLLDSFVLSYSGFPVRGCRDAEEAKQRFFEREDAITGTPHYRQYCKFLGLDEDVFKEQVSFSVWEHLGGYNRTVVADSAIKGRYHVMTHFRSEEKYLFNYAIVENGELKQEFIVSLPDELKDGLRNLIELYEAVRNLNRIDSNHCPIMEFQTHNGKDYFLQYHRARDFSPSEFILDRNLKEGEIEVPFVRGATSKDGMDCKVTVYYKGQETWNFDTDIEDGSYDMHWNQVFPELRVGKRKVQMIDTNEKLEWELMKFVVGHLQTSKLFKPQVSIIHNIEELLGEEESMNDLGKKSREENAYIDLHIVSDGRRAYISRI